MQGRELVAWNVRRLRVKVGLSQEKLAVDAAIDRTYVGGVERALENPTVAVLDRLAVALAVHVSELFKEPREGSSPPKPLRGGRRIAKHFTRRSPPSIA
jgi:transcriptional regulator with XRE-family HTH domain